MSDWSGRHKNGNSSQFEVLWRLTLERSIAVPRRAIRVRTARAAAHAGGGRARSRRRTADRPAHRQDRLHLRRPRLAVEHDARPLRHRPRRQQRDRRGLRQSGPDDVSTPTTCCGRRDGRADAAGRAADQRGGARQRLGRRDVHGRLDQQHAAREYYDEDYGAVADAVPLSLRQHDNRRRNGDRHLHAEHSRRPASIRSTRGSLRGTNRTTQTLSRSITPAARPRSASTTARSATAGFISARTTSTPAARRRLGSVQISNKAPATARSSSPTRSASATAWATYDRTARAHGHLRLSARGREFRSTGSRDARHGHDAGDGHRRQHDNVSAPSNMARVHVPARQSVRRRAVYIGFHSNGHGDPHATAAVRRADRRRRRRPHAASEPTWRRILGRQINQDMQALNGVFEYNWSDRHDAHVHRASSARSTWAPTPRWTPRSSRSRSTTTCRTPRSCAIPRAAIRSRARCTRERCEYFRQLGRR